MTDDPQATAPVDPLTIPGPVDVAEFRALATKAYGWSVFTNCEVAGLIAGDMGYESCGTKWGDLISHAMGEAEREVQNKIHEKLAELAELCMQAICK